jgi:hypothetical protein
MCEHDRIDWKDIGMASSIGKEIADEERERKRLQKLLEPEEDEDTEE